ncbi:TIGR02530 family flagellar biosynthesis protein [Halonatronum saccharophilum]|uniref:TIGR02530 family flagellar biosynthesis protein n=1 Tax=Halonatronum saccharophilum TaxID=150060 RepID=UPI0004897633|nr:TIGR02530 family flagellar biosynthesis protein [Halonatronum saccharophilum]
MNRIYSNRILNPPQGINKGKTIKKGKIPNFEETLKEKMKDKDTLKFSKHASKRLESRDIDFKEDDLKKLEEAVNKAKGKGVKESLVLLNNNAYIVSVKNQTVITAMGKGSMEDNLFTNIDSAIIIK